jgi:hypothetical protein
MSTVTRIILEAETVSAMDFIQAAMREEALRASALRAAARQTASRREPSMHQKLVPVAGPARGAGAGSSGGSERVSGAPITNNNSPGRPEVRVVGRSPQPARPIRHSMKSRIVPEPDQIQSAPPRRSSPLEPPGF